MARDLFANRHGEEPLIQTHGKRAQRFGAVVVGGYAFFAGLFIGQLVCASLHLGGG